MEITFQLHELKGLVLSGALSVMYERSDERSTLAYVALRRISARIETAPKNKPVTVVLSPDAVAALFEIVAPMGDMQVLTDVLAAVIAAGALADPGTRAKPTAPSETVRRRRTYNFHR